MVLGNDSIQGLCLVFFPLRFVKGRINTTSKKFMQGPPRYSPVLWVKSLALLWLVLIIKALGG